MAENKVKDSIAEVRKGIQLITSDMDALDKKILSMLANAKKVGGAFKANTPDSLTQILTQQNDMLAKMNTLLEKQNTNTVKLSNSRRTLKQLSSEEVVNQRKLAKNADAHAQSVSKLVGAYDNLVARTRQAKQRLNDLNSSQRASKKEVAAATREFKKYQAQLNKVNKATSNFSNNSLGGMVRGFRNLLGAFGIVGGITMFAQLTKDVFRLIKNLESLKFALETVTSSASELAQTQEFLLDISTRYGVNLLTTTERFTKFLAAAKQSNIDLIETERIFESVTKASAVLGLNTEELTGVYLALEQMLSKGKVTTEELRRQLGERLPGAFGIMADALGVTISQLDKMLKKGEVLSADALPKFAEQLEKAYGIEAVNTVETLAAAQGKLETAWISFVSSVDGNESKLTNIFKGLLNLATETLDGWRKILMTQEGIDASQIEAAQSAAFNEALTRSATIVKQHGENQKQLAVGLLESLIESNEESIAGVQQKIQNFFGPDRKGNQRILTDADKEVLQEFRVQIAQLTGTTDAYKQKIKEVLDVKKEDTEEDNEKLVAVRGSIAFLETYIKKLEEQQSKLATNTTAYRDYSAQIRAAKEELLELRAAFENNRIPEIDVKFNFDDAIKDLKKALGESDIEKELREIGEKGVEGLAKKVREANEAEAEELQRREERFRDFTQMVGESFSEVFDFDLGSIDFLFEHATNTIMDWADLSKEAIGSVLDASLNRYDVELQEAQRSRDLIVNNELATEKEKRLAREKFEEEERRIKTKRAKQERTNTLIKIAVDTAAAIASTLAPPPLGYGPLLGPATIPIIAGIGAAQAALVASQPIPKFAEGTKEPLSKDTLAYVGDGGRPEAVTKDGKLLGVTPDKTTMAWLPKGAEVHKDAKSWIDNAVYQMNMASNGQILNSLETDHILHNELKKLTKETVETKNQIMKLGKRPVKVKNTVIVEQPYDGYS